MKQAGTGWPNCSLVLTCLEKSILETHGSTSITLHVRKSNIAALNLYAKTLGFQYYKFINSTITFLGLLQWTINIMRMEKMHIP